MGVHEVILDSLKVQFLHYIIIHPHFVLPIIMIFLHVMNIYGSRDLPSICTKKIQMNRLAANTMRLDFVVKREKRVVEKCGYIDNVHKLMISSLEIELDYIK